MYDTICCCTADNVLPRIKKLGYNAIQLMAIQVGLGFPSAQAHAASQCKRTAAEGVAARPVDVGDPVSLLLLFKCRL